MARNDRGSGRAALIALLGLLSAGCGADSNPSYTIGGTVTGLNSGAQLALSNNAGTALRVSVNGSYAFPAAVALNGSYAITIATQPNGQICSVSNSSGAGVVANVTNVAVVCSIKTYTIGGSVTGLAAGLQLVLQDNGADALNINVNGRFTFATPVAFDGSYAVTVATQPAGMTCTVSNLSGAGVVATIGNVLVSCSSISYTIGGMVTGLSSGLQVTLQDNASDALIVRADGAFTFATPVAYGSSYVVTIGTEPVGQICTASSPSGSAVHANVASIAVTCATLSYTIGGSVSGLDPANQVTLYNNGDDALIVTANGAFTFATPVARAGAYAVTIATNPFVHTCTVTYGTGPDVSADVSTVAITCASFVESTLYSFTGGNDGAMPRGAVIQGQDGNLYGTTLDGGTSADGTIYSVTPGGTETILHSFGSSGTDGIEALGALIQTSDGNFYGTTINGGANGAGTVYSVTPAGLETVVYAFSASAPDGNQPISRVLLGGDGNLYGTTLNGGTYGQAVIYRVTPAGVETILHEFGAINLDGNAGNSGLIQASDGMYYGTTEAGGAANAGTVFSITAAGVETVLHSFGTGIDASDPQGELIQGGDGDFYGVSAIGGSYDGGAIFEVTSAGVESLLYSFGGTTSDGMYPSGPLLVGADGNFYGTTVAGGASNSGTIFVVTPAGVETVLDSFGGNSTDGGNPYSGVILGSDGTLYGTTSAGGPGNNGTVFRFGP